MAFPDLTVVSGYSQGLGRELVKSLKNKRVLGIARTYCEDLECDQLVLDLCQYKNTQIMTAVWRGQNLFLEKLGIVLCAGTLGISGGIADWNLPEWEEILKINLLGNLGVLKGFYPQIEKTGFGRVVFIAGGGAAYAYPKFSGYSLSKVAIVREVENIAEETKDMKNFSIIALAPGAMETNMLAKVRRAGAEVKTTVDISEPVNFIKNFLKMDAEKAKSLSGKFIHVRDDLNSDYKDKWLLRRTE
jgi:3-oxoacyl-[acyl-carrier protein] reductase